MLRAELEDLTGRLQALQHLLVRQPCSFHRDHLVHSDKAVAIQVGSRSTQRLLWCRRIGLSSLHRFLSRGGVMAGDFILVGTHEVTSAGTYGSPYQSSKQSVVLPPNGCPDCGSTHSANARALCARRAGEVFAPGGSNNERCCR